jgi:hypothetical protein
MSGGSLPSGVSFSVRRPLLGCTCVAIRSVAPARLFKAKQRSAQGRQLEPAMVEHRNGLTCADPPGDDCPRTGQECQRCQRLGAAERIPRMGQRHVEGVGVADPGMGQEHVAFLAPVDLRLRASARAGRCPPRRPPHGAMGVLIPAVVASVEAGSSPELAPRRAMDAEWTGRRGPGVAARRGVGDDACFLTLPGACDLGTPPVHRSNRRWPWIRSTMAVKAGPPVRNPLGVG